MDPGEWNRLQSIFFSALELPPDRRAAFLDEACAGDADLREEVDAVLAAHERAGGSASAARPTSASPDNGSDAPAHTGRQLGPYRLEERIGRGGMGEVYRAQRVDEQYRQTVAVKLLRSSLPADEMARRFRVERQVLARLQHPNVAALLDGGVAQDGSPYLVMQYVEGSPITDYADQHALPIAARLRLFATVCRAVHFAHSNLVVHRDLKPSNILVTPPAAGESAGQVRLLDFGIAKLLDPEGMGITAPLTEEMLLLTPEHAAPEQIVGGPITTATDVYALGVLLYELLTGTRPFHASLGSGWHRAVCEQEPTRPSAALTTLATERERDAARVAERRGTRPAALQQELRGDLDQIVLMALRKEPERRYASAEQFAEDVERYLEGRPVLARRDTLGYRARKFVRRNRLPVAAAAAMLLLLVGASALTTHQARARAVALAQAELERDRYRTARDQLLLENARAAQLSSLLVGLFERGGGESAADSLAIQRLLERGLARVEALYREPAEKAHTLTELGTIHYHVGDYEQAAALLERAIALVQVAADASPADASEARIALASVYWRTERTAEAEALLQQALAADSVQLQGDYPRIARALELLARVRQYRGDYAGAESAVRQALAMRQRLARADDVGVASATIELALLLRRRGEYREAEQLYRRALQIQLRFYSRSSRQIAVLLNDLGLVLIDLRRAAEAEPLLREALEICRHLYGSRHLAVTTAANSLARALSELDQHAEAEQLFAESLQMRRELFGPAHPRIVSSLLALGQHSLRRAELERAEAHFREALAMQRSFDRPGQPDEARALAGIGQARRLSGDLEAAEPLMREALRLQSEALGKRHPGLAATQLELGMLLHQRGDHGAAEPLLLSALRINQATFEPESRVVVESVQALAALYEDWGRPQDAARIRRIAVRP